MHFRDLRETVPWGRTFDEYVGMFALDTRDLGGRILDCGAGPASFAAEAAARGVAVIACDPLYEFSGADLEARFEEIAPTMLEMQIADRDNFVWRAIASPEALIELRRSAMHRFVADLSDGVAAGRYVTAELPELPFADDAFDLAVVSHLLFLYGHVLPLEFHVAAVRELLRVAREVRVFPLQSLAARPSELLEPVMRAVEAEGARAEIVPVGYEFQRGACRMLVVRRLAPEPA